MTVGGDRLLLLPDGPQVKPALMALIDGAERELRLLFYIFEGDRTGTEVRDALVAAARRGVDVQLAVDDFGSSGTDADFFQPLIDAGQASFGENRVQEAAGKWPALRTPATRLHLVGQLQSNKAREAVELFDAIHSVDRASLVEALARAQAATGLRRQLFAQVNIGAEDQKGGCAIAELPALLRQAADAGLAVEGLMCVPPADTEAAPFFALAARLARDNGLTRLSMGMSADYETAIMLGATQIRVGTALFGAR